MKRIAVCQIITRLDRGGSAEAVLRLSEDLARAGLEVSIVTGRTTTPQEDLEAYRRRTGIRIETIPSLQRPIDPVRDVRALLGLVRVVRRLHPAIVHTHTSKAGVLGRAAARIARVPVVVHSPHGHLFYGYYGPVRTRLIIWVERWAATWADSGIARCWTC